MGEENLNRFDADAWNALLRSDAEISEAAAKLSRFGQRYVDDLAASYLAIGEKRYLPVILTKLLQEAEKTAAASEANSRALGGDNAATPRWTGRWGSEADARRSASEFVDKPEASASAVVGRASPRFEKMTAWGLAALLIFLALAGGAQYLAEKSKFDAAHGDDDRLAQYVAQCWICAFKSSAAVERQRLQTEAASSEERRRQQEARDAEDRTYANARGDISRLRAYVETCAICAFKTSAHAEIEELQQRLNQTEELAREENDRIRAQNNAAQSANHVTIRMLNNTGLSLAVAFYSETRRGTAWPSWTQHYSMLAPSNDYNLACQPGEKICYGAWLNDHDPNDPGQYWGVGMAYSQGCSNCCVTCDGGIHVNNLAAGSGTGAE